MGKGGQKLQTSWVQISSHQSTWFNSSFRVNFGDNFLNLKISENAFLLIFIFKKLNYFIHTYKHTKTAQIIIV